MIEFDRSFNESVLICSKLQSKTEKKSLAESFNKRRAGSILSDSIRPIAPGDPDPASQILT